MTELSTEEKFYNNFRGGADRVMIMHEIVVLTNAFRIEKEKIS
jgi:hypothetical protein